METVCSNCGTKHGVCCFDVDCVCGCTINAFGQVIERPYGHEDEEYYPEEEIDSY